MELGSPQCVVLVGRRKIGGGHRIGASGVIVMGSCEAVPLENHRVLLSLARVISSDPFAGGERRRRRPWRMPKDR